jgi:hypothetical protein
LVEKRLQLLFEQGKTVLHGDDDADHDSKLEPRPEFGMATTLTSCTSSEDDR